MMLALYLIAYAVLNYRSCTMPPLLIWAYAQGFVFLAYTSISPRALRVQAAGAGAFAPGVAVATPFFLALGTVCFLPSWWTVVLVLACSSGLLAAVWWQMRYMRNNGIPWLSDRKTSSTYGLAMALTILTLLALGFAMSVFT